MLSGKLLRLLKRSGWFLCLLIAFVLGIKQLREPDIWWMLRTGQWILQNGTIMKQDVFSFTFEGTPWLNVKWGFEVLLVWLSRIGGPEITLLLQSVANVLLLTFVYKVYKLWLKTDEPQKKRYLPGLSIIAAAYLLLFCCEFRFNGRPEMVSHVMTAVYLFVMLSWRFQPSKFIFALIPLQILWVNLHEAYGTGVVMMLAMLGATWFEYLFIFKQNSNSGKQQQKTIAKTNANIAPADAIIRYPLPPKPVQLSIAVAIAILACAIHPWGLRMIIHPFEIFSQVQENKFTSELFSFTEKEYWQKEAYLNIMVFIAGLAALFFHFRKPEPQQKNKLKKPKQSWYLPAISRFSLGYIAFYFMFFYLSLTAYRNIPFFIIIATPAIARGLHNLSGFIKWRMEKADKLKSFFKAKSIGYTFAVVFGVVAYFMVVSGTYYRKLDEGRDRYGLKVNPVMNPIGAAYFIADNNINGNCFSDFLISNFLLWQLRPDFKTYIDLRDLDVFPANFFEEFINLAYTPDKFEETDKKYNFNYAVINRNYFQAIHHMLVNHKDWILAYADPVAAVYLKRNKENKSTIERLGLEKINGEPDVFREPMEWENSRSATAVSRIFRPGYDPDYSEEVNYDLIAADFYKTIGRAELALARAEKASQAKEENWKGFIEKGNILYQMSSEPDTTGGRELKLQQATDAYIQALNMNKDAENAYLGLGMVKLEQQDIAAATDNFKRALKVNDKNANTYLYLAQAQNYLMQMYPDNVNTYLKARVEYLEKAYKLNKDNLYVRYHLGIASCQLAKCKDCKNYLEDIINFPGVTEDDRNLAKQLLMQCGGSL